MPNPNKNHRYAALAVATLLLALNFWAWSLISPLATSYKHIFGLSPLAVSALVAAPVLVGSLGRIPLGMLTDRYGGRRMLTAVCWLAGLSVGGLALAGSYSSVLAAAVCLGIAGAAFAVGVPFVNSWFSRRQRGFALGIYAMGNAGTAVSGLLTPRLADLLGRSTLFWIITALLIAAGTSMAVFGRDAPGWRPVRTPLRHQLKAAADWWFTWRLALLYAVTFGAFVALGLYLPVLLNQSYGLEPADAAARAAGFVLLATLARPFGGWLSDRLSGIIIVRTVFFALFVLAGIAAARPALSPIGTFIYLAIAATLGIGNGAVFAIIGHRCKGPLVGTVTGLVGAAGGLGGYFPPLIMGFSYQMFKSYSAALVLLAVICLIIFLNLGRLLGRKTRY